MRRHSVRSSVDCVINIEELKNIRGSNQRCRNGRNGKLPKELLLAEGDNIGLHFNTAADDVLAFLGEEQGHHAVCVVTVGRRTEQHVHRLSLSDAYDAGGGIITGLLVVEAVAFVHQHGGECFGGVTCMGQSLHKLRDIIPPPAKVVGGADACMGTAVAHGDENVIFLQADQCSA